MNSESLLKKVANCFGYDLHRRYRAVLRAPIAHGSKLHVGCGDQELEGYVNCDLRLLPHVQLSCRAWEISRFCSHLAEIYSRHMLEHLTLAEAQLALQDWHQALQPGGVVRIEVPNLEFAMQQCQRAEWTANAFNQRFSDTRWGFAGLFGWQRECDPLAADYNNSYWDVHKSGYTGDSLRFFLQQAGFEKITITFEGFTEEQLHRRKIPKHGSDNCHLIAVAQKSAGQIRRVA